MRSLYSNPSKGHMTTSFTSRRLEAFLASQIELCHLFSGMQGVTTEHVAWTELKSEFVNLLSYHGCTDIFEKVLVMKCAIHKMS